MFTKSLYYLCAIALFRLTSLIYRDKSRRICSKVMVGRTFSISSMPYREFSQSLTRSDSTHYIPGIGQLRLFICFQKRSSHVTKQIYTFSDSAGRHARKRWIASRLPRFWSTTSRTPCTCVSYCTRTKTRTIQ